MVPNNTTFPVFLAVDYQPQPLREKAAPGTVVIQISALYSSQVIYTIEAGNDEGKEYQDCIQILCGVIYIFIFLLIPLISMPTRSRNYILGKTKKDTKTKMWGFNING